MVAATFLDQLRQATRAAHQALDLRANLGEQVTRQRYIAFLQGSLIAVERVEPVLLPFAEPSGLPAVPRRSACLRADLHALGGATSHTPQRATQPPELATAAGAVGATYVVEGSALGGVVMARRVEAALCLEGRALSYLRYRSERTGEAWRRCVSALTAWGEGASDQQRRTACTAACSVFALYEHALDEAGALND
jgi:heme oxygenase